MEVKTEIKKQIPSKRQFLVLIPFALLYGVFIVLGNWQKSAEYSNLQNVGRIVCISLVSYLALHILCRLIARVSLSHRTVTRKRTGKWYTFPLFFLFCLLCYLPYYLMYFPTWFNNDAVWQVEQILGWKARSNHHPYFHTMIMQFFFRIGYGLFGNYTDAAAFYTFWQMAFVALTFAFCLYVLFRRGTRLLWIGAAMAFYTLLPVHGMLSICMGKDSFFVSALLLFALLSHICVREREGKTFFIVYFIAGLLVCLLRSNGIFIFAGTMFILILTNLSGKSKRHLVRLLICAAAVCLCYLLYQGPVLKALHVEPPDTIEGLSMPAQHLMCTYVKGGNMTAKEVDMLDRVAPVEGMEEHYNPYLFDVAKAYIREEGNQQVIEENKWEYFKLWLGVGLKNPMLYLEAEVRQTAGYWAYATPHDQYLYGEYFMVDNPFGIASERKLFTYDDSLAMGRFLMKFQEIYNKVWSLGRSTWLMLFAMAYMLYQRKRMIFCIPFVVLLGSLMLATPVYNEFRYAYGLFAAFPLMFAYAFGPAYTYGEECGVQGQGEGQEDEKTV